MKALTFLFLTNLQQTFCNKNSHFILQVSLFNAVYPKDTKSGVDRGLINQSSTLRKLKYKRRRGTCLKSYSWFAEQLHMVSGLKLQYFHTTSLLILIICLKGQLFHYQELLLISFAHFATLLLNQYGNFHETIRFPLEQKVLVVICDNY